MLALRFSITDRYCFVRKKLTFFGAHQHPIASLSKCIMVWNTNMCMKWKRYKIYSKTLIVSRGRLWCDGGGKTFLFQRYCVIRREMKVFPLAFHVLNSNKHYYFSTTNKHTLTTEIDKCSLEIEINLIEKKFFILQSAQYNFLNCSSADDVILFDDRRNLNSISKGCDEEILFVHSFTLHFHLVLCNK